ncbi:thermonuclease family protein [Vibrio sp. Of7-15]|uniref:thermonuclease family protein n=1 Tax=Vibrio sp. Of7-15 TaxID=2724879 RepID=UPI001EF25356|nr:thermonuclease family protein [Vibrio sp. Of7-15]MCG7499358.1 thermonuclease family protein [Vibrio sp. Of7-15]
MYRLMLILLISGSANAASIKDKNHGTLTVSEVTSIYDGDTFRANIKDVHSLIGERIGIRVSGVDTPEIRGKCKKEKALAQKAKQLTVNFLRSAKKVELKNVKRGKYFRIVADVYADNESLTEALIDSGLAVAYDGGTKVKNWCE